MQCEPCEPVEAMEPLPTDLFQNLSAEELVEVRSPRSPLSPLFVSSGVPLSSLRWGVRGFHVSDLALNP